MEAAQWIWIPWRPGQVYSGLSLLFLYLILCLMGMPRVDFFQQFYNSHINLSLLILLCGVLTGSNYILTNIIGRRDYLLSNDVRTPALLFFFLLSLASIVIWCIYLLLYTDAKLASCLACIDWPATLKAFIISQLGIIAVLSFSLIWKPASKDATDFEDNARKFLKCIRKIDKLRDSDVTDTELRNETLRLCGFFVNKKDDLLFAARLSSDMRIINESSRLSASLIDEINALPQERLSRLSSSAIFTTAHHFFRDLMHE